MKIFFRIVNTVIFLFANSSICFAALHNAETSGQFAPNPVAERAIKEEKIVPDFFGIMLYKPTYILPYYYTASPDNQVYQNNTPNNQQLKHGEVKYQLSFKVPVWKNIFHHSSSLFLAYTQLSYWQSYSRRAFFRESDYEPELFLANKIGVHLYRHWSIDFINLGVTHQSNGFGNTLERSWNRAYVEAISSIGNWVVSLKPWYVMSTYPYNRDIANYLGYGQMRLEYKYNTQVFALTAHNLIEHGGRRRTAELTWSFPLTRYLKGYVQAFSGYGQSLIEYNHRTNSVGVGVTLNDWI